MTVSENPASKPSLVWFKAQAPGIRGDGSSMVTLRFAEELAADFDLHLVCLRTPATMGDPADFCVPPFTTVTVAETPHQRSPAHRLVFGAYYWLLDRARARPIAMSIEGARSVRQAVARRVEELDATAGIVEYWSAGRVLDAMPAPRRTLIVHDVEHRAAHRSRGSHRRMVLRKELYACSRATRVVFLSDDDREAFVQHGVTNGVTVPVPMPAPVPLPARSRSGATVGFVGNLDWGPNRRGLEWLLDEIWPVVRAQRSDARLCVIGGGEPGPPRSGVTYAGFVDDLSEELASIDVGVVPTRDGTGVKTKTLEFLAAGVPVVSTSNGVRGTSAAVAGALIAESAPEFAESIIALLDDSSSADRLVREGREAFLARHSFERLVERMLP